MIPASVCSSPWPSDNWHRPIQPLNPPLWVCLFFYYFFNSLFLENFFFSLLFYSFLNYFCTYFVVVLTISNEKNIRKKIENWSKKFSHAHCDFFYFSQWNFFNLIFSFVLIAHTILHVIKCYFAHYFDIENIFCSFLILFFILEMKFLSFKLELFCSLCEICLRKINFRVELDYFRGMEPS